MRPSVAVEEELETILNSPFLSSSLYVFAAAATAAVWMEMQLTSLETEGFWGIEVHPKIRHHPVLCNSVRRPIALALSH